MNKRNKLPNNFSTLFVFASMTYLGHAFERGFHLEKTRLLTTITKVTFGRKTNP